tara:strand:- start:15442 stop:17301 length:1860 start_codon:yes stop_codon:yes gene_type:complete
MSYKLNKTDGELLVELADGVIDTVTTDITLVGKNYKGFGEFLNENFIKLMENFAGTGVPGSPLVGQMWYDTGEARMKLYDGIAFRSAGGPIISNVRPNMVAGDIWIDNENNKMYFFDGTDLVLVGPGYDAAQGQSGFEVVSIIDISARERVILKLWIGGTLFGIVSKEEFRLAGSGKIPGFPDDAADIVVPARQLIKKGFNVVDASFWYQGTAAEARSLVNNQGVAFTSADFLSTTSNSETVGTINIKNSAGLTVGVADTAFAQLKIINSTTALETQQSNTDLALRTRQGNAYKDAVYVKGANDRVGIFKNNPLYTLDVNGTFRSTGDAVIDGDLTVNGNATYINVSNIQVEDINIELGVTAGTSGDDTAINGGGIILRSSDGDKTILFDNATDSFDANLNLNLTTGNSFKINDTLVLSSTELGSSITLASGLSEVGTLTYLNVDNIRLDGNTITTFTSGLTINPSGDISVSTSKITNLTDPTLAQDAATKNYVDVQISKEPVVMALDVTGLSTPTIGNPYSDVADIIQVLYPAELKQVGTVARIHCTSYVNVSVTGIDVQSAMDKSYLSVLTDDSSAQSVVQDINFSSVNANANLTPDRSVMTFVVSGSNQWDWQGTS